MTRIRYAGRGPTGECGDHAIAYVIEIRNPFRLPRTGGAEPLRYGLERLPDGAFRCEALTPDSGAGFSDELRVGGQGCVRIEQLADGTSASDPTMQLLSYLGCGAEEPFDAGRSLSFWDARGRIRLGDHIRHPQRRADHAARAHSKRTRALRPFLRPEPFEGLSAQGGRSTQFSESIAYQS